VVTPVTYHRYTSNCRGSIEGWIPPPGMVRMDNSGVLPHTLPGLVFVLAVPAQTAERPPTGTPGPSPTAMATPTLTPAPLSTAPKATPTPTPRVPAAGLPNVAHWRGWLGIDLDLGGLTSYLYLGIVGGFLVVALGVLIAFVRR